MRAGGHRQPGEVVGQADGLAERPRVVGLDQHVEAVGDPLGLRADDLFEVAFVFALALRRHAPPARYSVRVSSVAGAFSVPALSIQPPVPNAATTPSSHTAATRLCVLSVALPFQWL